MSEILFESTVLLEKDVWELERLEELAEDWEVRRTRMRPGEVGVNISFFNTPRLQFSCFDYNNAIFIEGSPPKGSIIVSVIQSDSFCSFHNQPLEPCELIIVKYGEEIDYLAKDANRIFSLAIEEQFFLQSFFHYFGQPLEEIRKKQRLLIKESHIEIYIGHMRRWLYYFKSENSLFEKGVYRGIEQEILGTLFSMIRTTERRFIKNRFDIAKAREMLHDNIDNIYTIGDLVEELQVSSRTLQYHFKNKLGFTPKQYLHQLRLNAIRKELLTGRPERTRISDIALKYGFFRSSHFAAEYKRVFGETPSQTLEYP